ncbi:sulfotransferase family protein [Desulfuribacillus alkaliarsenatis]|uniref:Sulfotransferase n=1 Tax=Desulfuribacillus alkaliarsenatis TaxID=766136 RepID=A0A1E5G1Q1_9FIRM|nr:sulfotransferase [Desulfuribacillus alkaliarsenatis]OEF96834.1 hypothetical protein BHF68_07175 [Desulfuribacillus alkaliarsenatis]
MFEKRIIIGGLPRSGSTLLRFILDSSESVISGPETRFFLEPLYRHQMMVDKTAKVLHNKLNLEKDCMIGAINNAANTFEAYDNIMLKYMELTGDRKAAWAEKTPINSFHYHRLVAENNEAYFISTVRNGLDVVTSIIENKSNDYWCTVQRYIDCMRSIYSFNHPNHIILKYEDLVTKPEKALKTVFEFLDLPFSENIIDNFNKESKTRDFSKVNQPKLKHSIQPTWVNRYKEPQHIAKVQEFINNEQAIYWFEKSGYTL